MRPLFYRRNANHEDYRCDSCGKWKQDSHYEGRWYIDHRAYLCVVCAQAEARLTREGPNPIRLVRPTA